MRRPAKILLLLALTLVFVAVGLHLTLGGGEHLADRSTPPSMSFSAVEKIADTTENSTVESTLVNEVKCQVNGSTTSGSTTTCNTSATQNITVREWQGPVGEWYSPLKDFRMLRGVVIGDMRGQTWTEAAIRDDMVNAGATWVDATVVRDGNWLTSRGPQDMLPFVRALVSFFAGQADTSADRSPAGSSPQRDAPPNAVLQAMKWMPRPSFRTVALIGAVAAFYFARQHYKGARSLAS